MTTVRLVLETDDGPVLGCDVAIPRGGRRRDDRALRQASRRPARRRAHRRGRRGARREVPQHRRVARAYAAHQAGELARPPTTSNFKTDSRSEAQGRHDRGKDAAGRPRSRPVEDRTTSGTAPSGPRAPSTGDQRMTDTTSTTFRGHALAAVRQSKPSPRRPTPRVAGSHPTSGPASTSSSPRPRPSRPRPARPVTPSYRDTVDRGRARQHATDGRRLRRRRRLRHSRHAAGDGPIDHEWGKHAAAHGQKDALTPSGSLTVPILSAGITRPSRTARRATCKRSSSIRSTPPTRSATRANRCRTSGRAPSARAVEADERYRARPDPRPGAHHHAPDLAHRPQHAQRHGRGSAVPVGRHVSRRAPRARVRRAQGRLDGRHGRRLRRPLAHRRGRLPAVGTPTRSSPRARRSPRSATPDCSDRSCS